VDGNDLYVVWQNSNKTFAEDVTLEEVVASSEIAVSKFDEVTGTFGAAVRLTENDVVDMLRKYRIRWYAYIVWFTNNKTMYSVWTVKTQSTTVNLRIRMVKSRTS